MLSPNSFRRDDAHHGSTSATFHLLDLDHFFIQGGNKVETALRIFVDLGRQLNVSLVVFGGGGLLQPGYAKAQTHWRLPLDERIVERLASIGVPYLAYGVGVNVFRRADGQNRHESVST